MKVYIKLLLTALFWGGTFVAGRVVSQEMESFSIAFLRFAVASVLLLSLTVLAEGRLPALKRGQIIPVILLGMTGVFAYNVMFFKGLRLIEASRAALIIATCPVFITLASAALLKERIGALRALGIALSVCGAAVVISKGNAARLFRDGLGLGEVYIFCCVLSWVAYSLIGKSVMRKLSPLAAVSYSSAVGAIALAVPAFLEGMGRDIFHIRPLNWLSIGYLAVFGTVIGFVWYYEGVRRIGPTRAGLFINFVPIFAVLSAFVILKEPITPSLACGAALVMVGVYLTNRPPKRTRRAEPL
jgi:drug/metabolite transporter (DMT)-like permease